MASGLEAFGAPIQTQDGSSGWVASEAAMQNKRPDPVKIAGIDGSASAVGPAQRVFPAGTEITDAMIRNSGIADNPQALNLAKNLLYRDKDPKAFFTTPGLEATIDSLTGTQGDATDPGNLARSIELSGPDLKNLTVLQNHEGAAKIAQWRADNQDKMTDTPFPPRLTPEAVAAETDNTKIQTAINDLFAEKGQPFILDANIQRYAPMKAYHPDPNFDAETALSSEPDRSYLKLLTDRRQSLQ
jgi:hypothetical protein